MTLIKYIFLLLFLFQLTRAYGLAEICDLNPSDAPDAADTCTLAAFNDLPWPMNRTFTVRYCGILFMIDLSPDYVSEEQFTKALLPALNSMTDQCLNVGVGHWVSAFPLFNKNEETKKDCCSVNGCADTFTETASDYDSWVTDYGNLGGDGYLWNDTNGANFSYVFLQELKVFDTQGCLFNTAVLITSRLFNYVPGLIKDFPTLPEADCITLTIILLGRPDITNKEFTLQYKNITGHLLQVNNISCIYEIAHCILPCGSVAMEDCYENANWSCPYPTPPPSTSRATYSTAMTTPSSEYGASWEHLVYLFALSNNTNSTEFSNALYFVESPLDDCLTRFNLVARFLAENDTDSGWMHDSETIHGFLEKLRFEEIIIKAHQVDDETETFTMDMMARAYQALVSEGESKWGPRVILMTDFVSKQFVNALTTSFSFEVKWLQQHANLEVYAFNKQVQLEYEELTNIPTRNLFLDDDFEREKGPQDICPPKGKDADGGPNVTVWFIIIGVSFGLMVILLVCTVVYRQKLMWMQKLYLFKNKDDSSDFDIAKQRDDEGDDIIDYWQISWDRLIVSSEKLGNGAYGLVYKGKMLGTSPGLEQYYPHESSAFRDCEVAVKIIHKHATEKELEMFLREIDTMKTLGFNEHIVNMLGCSTQSAKRSCLVLEYCSNRDLKRYILKRRSELDQSRSIDEQIDCTKEFLHFAWQMTSGMKYLVSRSMIHRDLAARNIMIDSLKNAKIGDFGLCVSSSDKSADVSGKLPIKWLAVESLESRKFSHKSDVWSFGMVLWEMYSMGESPFADVVPEELLANLKQGKRPKRPLLATDKLEEVMGRCWAESPVDRPSFDELLTIFTILLEQSKKFQATEGYGYLQLMPNDFYRNLPHIEEPEPDEEESISDRGRSRTASLKSSGMNIIGNMTNVLRAAAQGIGRQFSGGKGVYPTPDHPRMAKRKSGAVGIPEEGLPRLPMPQGAPRRKSGPNDFLSWTGLKRFRRKSFDPDLEKTIQPGPSSSRFDIPRLFSNRKAMQRRRKSSQSLPDLSPTAQTAKNPQSSHFFADAPIQVERRTTIEKVSDDQPPSDKQTSPDPTFPPLPRLESQVSDDSDSEMATLPSSPRASSCDTLSQI